MWHLSVVPAAAPKKEIQNLDTKTDSKSEQSPQRDKLEDCADVIRPVERAPGEDVPTDRYSIEKPRQWLKKLLRKGRITGEKVCHDGKARGPYVCVGEHASSCCGGGSASSRRVYIYTESSPGFVSLARSHVYLYIYIGR